MQCSICLESPNNPITLQCCKNQFCSDCLLRWNSIKTTCPLCTAPTAEQKINILTEQIHHFNQDLLPIQQEYEQVMSKVKQVRNRVQFKIQQNTEKSSFSYNLIAHLRQEMKRVESMVVQIQIYQNSGHRVLSFQEIQKICEAIINIEFSLDYNYFTQLCQQRELDLSNLKQIEDELERDCQEQIRTIKKIKASKQKEKRGSM